jgi:uncharacterized circularly permuted ATP-grasp superfamily protein/uncharacterized alpha-E superfamily protein
MAETETLDEMVDGQGGVRSHWRGLMGAYADLGREAMIERQQRMDRALAENFFGVSSPSSALWSCDALPLPLAGSEFAELEAGLAQRAELLEAVLQDIYGPQKLLEAGLLPPALVFPNPHFLRPSQRVGRPDGRMLDFYAADLMRGQDGRWRVLADRTDEAGGVAVVLENRRLMSRMVPELFQAVEAEPIHPFFDNWQDTLQRAAPVGVDNPGVALLTSGPNDLLWFEHVILSRELGCTLVEAGDLSVRGGELFLKTLRGLQRIDVLIRRQDGRNLDPLELAPGGGGVAGLFDAQRAGKVRIVNDPGAAFAESPGLSGFLPAISEHLNGERLSLASIATHWLGDSEARTRVLGTLPAWHLRSAYDGSASVPLGGRMSKDKGQKLAARIQEAPWEFCATAIQTPSTTPTVGPEGLLARPLVLRLFLMWNGRQWSAMPGGLARMLSEDDLLYGRLPRSGLAKDVWVLSEDRMRVVGPTSIAVPPLAIRRTRGELPSRVADDFFWFGRYLERLEGTARLLRAVIVRLARVNLSPREMVDLQALVDCLAQKGVVDEELSQVISLNRLADTLVELGREGGWLSGLLAGLNALKEGLRDRLTEEIYHVVTEALRELGALLRHVPKAAEGNGLERLAQAMHKVITSSATIAGLTAENMVRGGGRLFVDLGRRMERAQTIAAEIAHVLTQGRAANLTPEKIQAGRVEAGLRLAIELCDSVITYRNRYLTVLQPAPALDLVLADEGNPRALAYQIAAVRDLLIEISGGDAADPLAAVAAGLLAETMELVEDVAHALDQNFAAALLPPRLRAIEDAVAALSDRVTRQYFALLSESQSIGIDEEQEREPLLGVA